MSQFTAEEYCELRALAMLEPVGSERLFSYLAMICAGLGGKDASFQDLMYIKVPEHLKWMQYLDSVKGE